MANTIDKLTPRRRKIGNWLTIVPGGSLVGDKKVDASFDPSAADVTEDVWQWLGNAEEVTPTIETEDDPMKVFDKSTRRWREEKNTEAKTDTLKFTLQEYSQIIAELQYRTGGRLEDGTKAKPFVSSTIGKECWLHNEKYDSAGQIIDSYYWGILKLDGEITENDKVSKPKLVFEVLESEFNSLTPSGGLGYAKAGV